jgi:phage-related protein
MTTVHIRQYPNLVFTGEVKEALSDKSLSDGVKKEILEMLHLLNAHGNNNDYLGKRVEKTHRYKIWEMKFKDKSKTEWRIFFKKISKNVNPSQYGVIDMIRKTTPKLTKRDLDAAERIAKREGW